MQNHVGQAGIQNEIELKICVEKSATSWSETFSRNLDNKAAT